jgi:hypothetical protein
MSQLARVRDSSSALSTSGAYAVSTGGDAAQVAANQYYRVLTPEQLHLIYQRVPDVRAAIDQIVRQIATQDYEFVPTIEPDDDAYEELLEICKELMMWMSQPTADQDTWQELATAVVTDLLKYDAGVVERVFSPDGELSELVPLRGADIHPIVDKTGRLSHYVQTPTSVVLASKASGQKYTPEQILYLKLFSNTEGPEGLPLLESLVYEVISILRLSERFSVSVDLNEVPDGILVLTGIAQEAAKRFRAENESNAGQDHKLRTLISEEPGQVDAKWVRFSRDARDLQIAEHTPEIKRTIWRIFGVMPVEMGETDGMPRATAQVQLDVSGSHLILPILELLQAKINVGILPWLLDEAFHGLIKFAFKLEKQLSEDDRLSRSKSLNESVESGVLTRNEARKIGWRLPPIAGGDQPTIGKGAQTRLLIDVIGGVLAPEDPEAKSVDADYEDPEEEDEEDDDSERSQPSGRPSRERRNLRSNRSSAHSCRSHSVGSRSGSSRLRGTRVLIQRSLTDGASPSEWDRIAGEDVRTLDLGNLWEEMVGYSLDIEPIWEEVRTEAISALAAVYKPEGFDSADRQRVMAKINDALDKLALDWSVSSQKRYRKVAEAARVKAGEWTGYSADAESVRRDADAYHRTAMTYLTAEGGVISDLCLRLIDTLVRVTDVRDGPIPDRRVFRAGPVLSPTSTLAVVLTAVASAFDSAKHRIGNWAGKLVELSSDILIRTVDGGSHTGQAMGITNADAGSAATEWWCEWAGSSDASSCEVCKEQSSKGWIKLSDLRIRPGGATCRANCRCTIVVWTKAEIDGGRATYFGEGNINK